MSSGSAALKKLCAVSHGHQGTDIDPAIDTDAVVSDLPKAIRGNLVSMPVLNLLRKLHVHQGACVDNITAVCVVAG
eukprot:3131784-Amphidinium_carterae.1